MTFIETNAFKIKFETSVFETKKNFQDTRFDQLAFENRDTRIRGNRLFHFNCYRANKKKKNAFRDVNSDLANQT